MKLSNTWGQSTVPCNRLVQLLRRHPLLFYFLLAFGFTWPYGLIVFGVLHLPLIPWFVPAPFLGPTVSAFIMTAITQGRPGVRRLLHRYILWRVSLRWYVVVLLGPALILLGIFLVLGAVAAFRTPTPTFLLTSLVLSVMILIGGGPLGEEPGWRGFALPRLQQYVGPLVGTLMLGVLWSLWHLPLFLFVPGYDGAGTGFVGILIPYAAFIVSITASAVIYTWVFNNTRGSLLLMILLHASYDIAFTLGQPNRWLWYLAYVVVALLIIVATRGRLSYQRYRRETALPTPVTDRVQEQGEARTSL